MNNEIHQLKAEILVLKGQLTTGAYVSRIAIESALKRHPDTSLINIKEAKRYINQHL